MLKKKRPPNLLLLKISYSHSTRHINEKKTLNKNREKSKEERSIKNSYKSHTKKLLK